MCGVPPTSLGLTRPHYPAALRLPSIAAFPFSTDITSSWMVPMASFVRRRRRRLFSTDITSSLLPQVSFVRCRHRRRRGRRHSFSTDITSPLLPLASFARHRYRLRHSIVATARSQRTSHRLFYHWRRSFIHLFVRSFIVVIAAAAIILPSVTTQS